MSLNLLLRFVLELKEIKYLIILNQIKISLLSFKLSCGITNNFQKFELIVIKLKFQ
jgi:hypothetical protein